MSTAHSYIALLAQARFRIIPLHAGDDGSGKTPYKHWPKTPYTATPDLSKFPANYGLALDSDTVVIDVDPRNGGTESWKKLQADLNIDLAGLCGFVVKTGGGGGHFYFRKSPDVSITEGLPEYPGLEMKTSGRQVVGPGSVNFNTKKEYRVVRGAPEDINEIPDEVVSLYQKAYVKPVETGTADDSPQNLAYVRRVLDHRAVAVEGARGDDWTYQTACLVRDYGVSYDVALDLMLDFNDRCDPPWSYEELEKKVLSAYSYAQNALGAKNMLADFDELPVEPAATTEPVDSEMAQQEEASRNFNEVLAREWCYVRHVKRFIHLESLIEYDKEQFDDRFLRAAGKMKASRVALMGTYMRQVDFQTYWPGKDRFVTEDTIPKLNMWVAPDLDALPGDPAPFLEFVNYLVGEERAWVILDFIGHLVRHPGDKILWTPLIQGNYGIGKSILGRCVEALLGKRNVRRPTNSQLHEQYTTYMHNCQLVVVEELMAQGRLAMNNKLKDMITEPTISIREMYKNPYTILNRTNLMFLTNHEDSIVIHKDDRRFSVLFSSARPRTKEYYGQMLAWIDANAGALLGYFRYEHQFHPDFSAKGHAPWTEDKAAMVEATRHPAERTMLDWRDDGVPPMAGDFVDFATLLERMKPLHKGMNNVTLSQHMRACGFEEHGRSALPGGRRVRLWCINRMEMWRGEDLRIITRKYEEQSKKQQEQDHEEFFERN